MDIREIAETFEVLEPGEERYRYIIELGKDLEGLPDALKVEPNRVHGCMSQVWLVTEPDAATPSQLRVRADSDAFIVRGLIAILLALFDRKQPEEILAIDAQATFEQLGLEQHLSMGRRNGLHSMVQRVRSLATVHAAG